MIACIWLLLFFTYIILKFYIHIFYLSIYLLQSRTNFDRLQHKWIPRQQPVRKMVKECCPGYEGRNCEKRKFSSINLPTLFYYTDYWVISTLNLNKITNWRTNFCFCLLEEKKCPEFILLANLNWPFSLLKYLHSIFRFSC